MVVSRLGFPQAIQDCHGDAERGLTGLESSGPAKFSEFHTILTIFAEIRDISANVRRI
jgi:hypothetical protein